MDLMHITFLFQEWQQNKLDNVLDIHGAIHHVLYKHHIVRVSCNLDHLTLKVGPVCCGQINFGRYHSPGPMPHMQTTIPCMKVESALIFEHYSMPFDLSVGPLAKPHPRPSGSLAISESFCK